MEFVKIEPGTFTMGSPPSEPNRAEFEGPQHQVTISKGFYLGKYEITQGQWQAVMGTTPWLGQDFVREGAGYPAVFISWNDVQAFAHKLNQAAGDSLYRLPTEAEWEYACRAGTTTLWSFGNSDSQLQNYGWYNDNSWRVGEQYLHAVGLKLPNPWGLYDMHGNATEWVQDVFGDYLSESQTDPRGPSQGPNRIARGGVAGGASWESRSAARGDYPPDYRDSGRGGRLLKMLSPATVSSTNNAPVATGQSVATDEDAVKQITLTGTDLESSPLTFAIATQPSKGTVTLSGATATYTPTANANGSDSFTFTASDGQLTSATATVSITINPVNDAPVLSSIGNRSVSVGQALSINLSASDVDGDPLVYSDTGLPSGAVRSSASFTWTPTQAGTFSITFSVSDRKGGSQGETVQITVTAVVPASPTDAVPSPSAWDFGDQTSASPTERTFYIKNPGASQVTLTGLTVDTPVFAVLSPTLPRTVGAGDSVAVVVRFTPLANARDRQQGTLTLSSSAGVKTVTLSGRGTWVGLAVSPDTLKFDKVKPGSSGEKSITVSNPGNLRLEISSVTSSNGVFSAQPGLFSVEGGTSKTVTVTFAPTQSKVETGLLTLSGNADSVKAVVVLRGEGDQGPVPEVNPAALNFLNVRADSARTERITLRNSGGDTLKVRELAGLQSPFSVLTTQLPSLIAGDNSQFSIRFAPVARGIFNDTLLIVSNAETRQVPVTGRGTRAELAVTPERLVFDPVPAGGTSADLPLLISNSGDDTLVVTSIASTKPQRFQVGATSLVVPPNKAEQISVRFIPGVAEQDSADISIVTNVGTKQVRAAGSIGRPPEVEIRLSPDAFGNISVGKKSSLMQVTLVNRSSTSVTVEGLDVIPTDAPVRKGATSFPLALRRDQSVQVTTLEFEPTKVGPLSATLRVRVAGGVESNKSLLGNGVEGAKVEFDQDTLRVLNVAPTTANTGTVQLRNEGGDTLQVELVRVRPIVFTLTPNPGKFKVAPGESKEITVTFKPRIAGNVKGVLEVRSDAVDSPDSLTLLGTTPELSPKIVLSPNDSLRFASVGTGQDDIRPLTIRNDGQGVLEVSLASDRADFVPERDTVRVEAGQSRQVQIRFRPTQPGTRTGRLTVRSNDRQRESLFVGMRGFSGNLRFEPVSVDFGDVAVGAQRDTTVLLINETADAATLTLDMIGAGYTTNPRSSVRVDAGKQVLVMIRFQPTSLIEYPARLEVRGRGVSVDLFGKGVDVKIKPPVGLRASLDGSRVILSWNENTEPGRSHYVVYRNQQDNFEPTRADSIGRANKGSPGLTDTPPGGVGTFYYRVVAVDNQGNRSEPSETTSAVLASPPTVSDAALPFGEVAVGVTKTLVVVVTNPGTGTMNITNVTISGRDNDQFRPIKRTETIPAGQSKTVSITFSPRSSGLKTGVLNIAHDKGNPLTVALSGTGAADPLRVVPTSLSFANTEVGTPGTKTLRLINSGNSLLSVKLETSGADRDLFRLSRAQIQVRALNEAQVRVIFDPKTAGAKRATLIISPVSGNTFSRIEIPLSGSAVAARGLSEAMVDLAKVVGAQALQPALGYNYPNPFNAQTLIPYQLTVPGWVKLAVYDMLGQQVRTLIEGAHEAGAFQATWDSRSDLGNAVASGIYFIRLEVEAFHAVQKVVLLR